MMFQQTQARARSRSMTEGSILQRPPTGAMEVLDVVDGLATAEVDRTCLLLWRGTVTESRFRVQRQAMEHVTNRHPGDAVLVCIIEPTSEPPPQALREAASALLNQLGPKLRCVAYVIEGSGFRAAMIRGVLSGIELLRRSSYSARYFSNVADASTWIAQQTGRRSLGLVDASHRLRECLSELE